MNHCSIAYSLSSVSAKKLPKSVNVRQSYIVQHRCCFLRCNVDSVEKKNLSARPDSEILRLMKWSVVVMC